MDDQSFQAHANLEGRHWWFTARRAILMGVLKQVVPSGSRVIDFGCGTGGNSEAFAAAGYSVLGLDSSRDAIQLAQTAHPELDFQEIEAAHQAIGSLRMADAIVLADVLEHVDEDSALFELLVAALPTGAHLIVTVPANPRLWSAHDEQFGHRRRYTLEGFRRLWSTHPVSELLCTPFNSRLRILITVFRKFGFGKFSGGKGDLSIPMGPLNGFLRKVFLSEEGPILDALSNGQQPFHDGVSLLAVLRKNG